MQIIIPEDIKVLIFDCEGTLAHTKPLLMQASFIVFEELGYPQSMEFLEETWSLTIKKAIEELNSSGKANINIDVFNELRARSFEKLLPLVQPIEVALKIVLEYKQKLPMGIVSNGDAQIVHRIVNSIGLEDAFDHIICSYDGFNPKPSPDMLLEVAKKFDVLPHDCILIEDAKSGFQAADSAGMRWIDIKQYY